LGKGGIGLKGIKNQHGLTLLEVLLSITLLFIVIISFFAFFTQSFKYTQHNEEKLTASQIAEEVVAELREGTRPAEDATDTDAYSDVTVEIDIDPEPGTPLQVAHIIIKSHGSSGIKETFETYTYIED